MLSWLGILTVMLSGALALYLTPLAIRAARTWGIVARPDGGLRDHADAVPYLGGLAMYLALLLSLVFVVDFTPHLMGLLFGGTIILMVGLIDDFGAMTPRVKLFGQVIAVLALIKGGVYLKLVIFDFRWPLELPLFPWVLSAVWLVGMANALNFLDIEDGLAGGVAACCCPALFTVAWLNGQPETALFIAGIFGATAGFLRYNLPFPKARVYMGDAGSLFLGLSLGALAMIGSYTEKNDLAAVCPAIILGVPCFELMVVVVARLRKGIPIWYGSRDHVSKRLVEAGLSKRASLYLHCGTSLLLGGLAIFIMNTNIKNALIAVSGLAAVALPAFFLILRIKMEEPGQE
ncbi:MAG: MraY family glycosyltransferase [bacterium]